MSVFSGYRVPESKIQLDLVQIRLWFHPDDSDIEFYEVPAKTVKQLAEFVETGEVAPQIRADLEAALQCFPAWDKLSVDASLSKEQRESAAGRFVMTNGHKVAVECTLKLDVAVY